MTDSRRPAGLTPALEYVDPVGGPGAVARHRPVSEPLENAVGALLDVLIAPEVEGEFHRGAVALAEHRLDVPLEADGLPVARQFHLLSLIRVVDGERRDPRSGCRVARPPP